MSGIFAVFTPDCVSFCEVSSHAANSKGRRLRFLGSHRRIVMLFYLILFAPDSFRNLFNLLELVPLLQPGQLVADLAGGKTTLRAQAEAVHFSASWMRAITVSLSSRRENLVVNQAQHNLFAFGHIFQRLKTAGALIVKLQIESIHIFLGKQEPNMFPPVEDTLLPLSLLKL